MSLELVFNVTDKASPAVKRLNAQLKQLNPTILNTSKVNKKLDTSFIKMAVTIGTVIVASRALAGAYKLLIQNGLDYNKEIEQQTASIKTLLGATSQNIDSLGNVLTAQQKYNLAGKEAIGIMKDLEVINAKTPQTLDQTAKLYKTMLPGMRAVGATQKDLIKLTEKIAIAGSAAGIEFRSLISSVDGLASGTVLANSDLGRFLKAIGITNKVLRESDDVVGLLTKKFSDFKALDTITVAASNLTVEWNKLTGALTKDAFEAQKDSIKELTNLLKTIDTNDIKRFQIVLNNAGIGLTEFATGSIRFVNGLRITFNEIGYYIGLALDSAKFGFFTLKLEMLEFMESTQNILNKGFKFSGLDKRVSLVGTTEIEEFKDSMIDLGLGVSENTEKFNKMKKEGKDFNQIIIKGAKIITDGLKEQNKKLREQLLLKGKIVTEDNKIVAKTVANTTDKSTAKISFAPQQSVPELIQEWDNALLKFPEKMNDVNNFYADRLEQVNKDNEKIIAKGGVDISSSISTAIIDGINGSGLEDILKSFSASVGQSLISTGVSQAGIGAVAAGDSPYALLGAGVALTALSSSGLFGGGSSRPSDSEVINSKASEAMEDFTNNLVEATDRLNAFGNTGSTTENTISTLTSQISSLQAKNEAINNEFRNLSISRSSSEGDSGTHLFESARFQDKYFHASGKDNISYRRTVEEQVRTYRDLLLKSNTSAINTYSKELTTNLTNSIANSLDFSSMNSAQLTKIVGTFDQEIYTATLTQINDLAVRAKQAGGVLSTADQAKLIELYTLPDFIKGQDYEGAIAQIKKLTEALFDMTTTSNDFELSFKSLGATTEEINSLRMSQIIEEKAFLSNELPKLSQLTKDNFVSLYEAIDPSNTDLVDAYEQYGDLLVEQAYLTYDLANATDSMTSSLQNAINTIKGNIAQDLGEDGTDDLIRRYNLSTDVEEMSRLATQISSSAFGDTSNLNANLISSLEQAKLDLGFEDEIINVNIVSSDITAPSTTITTPTVNIASSANATSDQRLATIEALLIELLKDSRKDLAIQQDFQENGMLVAT